MGIFKKLLKGDPQSIYQTCLDIYSKAKSKRPGKPEQDYLKLVLLTKPPFDYQADMVIDAFLEEYDNIQDLASFIANIAEPRNRATRDEAFRIRERNLKERQFLKDRNKAFFEDFWSG